ncbi:hypothetical protein BgiBS90_013040, partial [Biomphalaria glabrata]
KNAREYKNNITFRTDVESENGIYLLSESLTKSDVKKFICILEVYETLSKKETYKREPNVKIQ